MCVYCVYPAMSKSPKQQSTGLQRAETSVVLIIFSGILSHIRFWTINLSVLALREPFVSKLYSVNDLTAQVETVHDKIYVLL